MLEALFEYMVPLTGIFKKKRDPKMLEAYQEMDDISEILEDFKTAKSYWNDAVRIGKLCIFRKEKYTVLHTKNIAEVNFRVYGADATDEYSAVTAVYHNGHEELLYKTPSTDAKMVAEEVFEALSELGIKTVYK